MSIFDSHCHPHFPQYDKDRGEVIKRALDQGVFMICVGTDLEMSKKAVELANKYDHIWATVGLHPNEIDLTYDTMMYHKLVGQRRVVAIGEIGLDYYRTPEAEKQERQKEVFKQFLDLAIQYDKPVVIHCRDAQKGSEGLAHRDAIEIIKNLKLKIKNSPLCGVAHSFTGTKEEAEMYINLDFYLGFNGIITFTRQYDEIIKYVPLDKILLETDAPYLAPEPYRGQRNEPMYVIEVAKKLAELKKKPLEKIIEQTTRNCKKLFKIWGTPPSPPRFF